MNRITYRRAMMKGPREAAGVPATVLEGSSLPASLVEALSRHDYATLGGKYGEASWGTPIEYDHVVIEHAGGRTEIEVFNRGIHSVRKDSAQFRRVFRVCEALRRACEKPTKEGPAEEIPPDEVRRLLITAGEKLKPSSREQILKAGASAVPALIEILVDEDLSMQDGPGDGYASIHAARLLGDLAAVDAVEPMLDVLAATDWDTILHDAVLVALPKIGAAVLEPALIDLVENDDADWSEGLRGVISELGIHDDRIRKILVAELRDEPGAGAMHLGNYGDASAIPLLHDAFDSLRPRGEEGFLDNQALIELKEAIEELGGGLSEAQEHKIERALEARVQPREEEEDDEDYDADAMTPVRAEPKPGRNEPCWCGNGKKYKKCHLGQDEAGER